MRILILGAGKMGSFFVDLLSFEHEVAVYDVDPKRLRFMYNTQRFTRLEEIDAFNPEFLINAVSLNYTLDVFKAVTPHLSPDCILSDIASVKTNLKDYYDSCGFRYVSTAAYIVMGWVALIAIGPLVRSLSGLGTMWLALGGGLYTVGCVFYLWRGLPYSHPIWHLFVLAATICHFFCILWYVMA